MRRLLCAFAVLILVGCERDILYSVSAANYGEYGVVLRKFPTRLDGLTDIRPGIPGVRADVYEKSHFRDYPDSLPKQVEVVWQLADLTDCDDVIPWRSRLKGDDDPRVYVSKIGCDFTPIEGKVFRKVVDLNKIMETEAGQRAGKLVKPWWTLSRARYGLSIAFEFRDEELEVRALTYRTNPWK